MTNKEENILNYLERLKKAQHIIANGEIDNSFENELNSLLSELNDKNLNNFDSRLKINIKKLVTEAVIPSYSKDGDAGLDLTAVSIMEDTEHKITYGFGLALEIPRNYVGLIFPRSSNRKYHLTMSNCVGVIDSGYRGEIQATFFKFNYEKPSLLEKYNIGERIAQIIIIPYPSITFNEVNELSDTERGTNGFGHTGL